jgi:hypothetical protein
MTYELTTRMPTADSPCIRRTLLLTFRDCSNGIIPLRLGVRPLVGSCRFQFG